MPEALASESIYTHQYVSNGNFCEVSWMSSLTFVVGTILMLISAIHVLWGLGVVWPAADAEDLAQMVIGGAPGRKMASSGPCFAVASVLFVAALGALSALGGISDWVRLGTTVVLGLRGVGGFFDTTLRPSIRGSTYVRLNLVLYSPLCLLLAALLLLDRLL